MKARKKDLETLEMLRRATGDALARGDVVVGSLCAVASLTKKSKQPRWIRSAMREVMPEIAEMMGEAMAAGPTDEDERTKRNLRALVGDETWSNTTLIALVAVACDDGPFGRNLRVVLRGIEAEIVNARAEARQ